MNHSPVKTIFVPALLTAGVVFCLSMTVVTNHGVLPSSNVPQELALREQYRNQAVRNIGCCILISVLSGMGVAAGLRKLQKTQQNAKEKQTAVSGSIAEFLSARPE